MRRPKKVPDPFSLTPFPAWGPRNGQCVKDCKRQRDEAFDELDKCYAKDLKKLADELQRLENQADTLLRKAVNYAKRRMARLRRKVTDLRAKHQEEIDAYFRKTRRNLFFRGAGAMIAIGAGPAGWAFCGYVVVEVGCSWDTFDDVDRIVQKAREGTKEAVDEAVEDMKEVEASVREDLATIAKQVLLVKDKIKKVHDAAGAKSAEIAKKYVSCLKDCPVK
jgi:DNA repair exonuclease SbcCD ATPase subunit